MSKILTYANRFIFLLKKPAAVFIFGSRRNFIAQTISHIVKNESIKLYPLDSADYDCENLEFFVKNSSLPIFIVSKDDADYSEHNNFHLDNILKLVKLFPPSGFIIIDKESPIFRKIKSEAVCRVLSYGDKEADIFATDINVGGKETNFKINYEGKSIPFWIEKELSQEQINIFLPSIISGIINKINLVEISQSLKNYNF